MEELDKEAKSIDKGTTIATPHAHKTNKYPDEFILNRPEKENQNKSEQSDDDDFDIEPREKENQQLHLQMIQNLTRQAIWKMWLIVMKI